MASLSKNKIKYIHSLELKKIRKEERVFLAEGPKLVGDLLGHFPCRFLAATPSWFQEHPLSFLKICFPIWLNHVPTDCRHKVESLSG